MKLCLLSIGVMAISAATAETDLSQGRKPNLASFEIDGGVIWAYVVVYLRILWSFDIFISKADKSYRLVVDIFGRGPYHVC